MFEERLLRKDGKWHWFETTLTNLLEVPTVGAIVDHSRDITERVQVEETLRESEREISQRGGASS